MNSSSHCIITVLLLCIPATAEEHADKANIVGRIGDTEIKIEDIRAALAPLGDAEKQSIAKDSAQLNTMVRALLVQRLVLKEALEKKWDEKPDIALQLQRVRESAITETYLQSISQPPDNYPGEDELKAAYEAAKPSLLVPKTYRLSQIYIAELNTADATARSDAKLKLAVVREALKKPNADFAALAAAHSEDAASVKNGGEIGWLADAQIQPEIRAQLPKLAVNLVSDPIRLDDGWHIIKVTDIREAHTPTLVQIRPQLVRQMRADKTRENQQAHLAALLKANPVAVNELALSQILPKSAEAK
ncbi:MAG: peptidylprolyl isomerase [Verrucomicrobiaceae bacterium]|nr:peptidylprolyl isomerase [Verrucomicrobiaceae bacterium]